jgi:hypothetical protein
MQKLKSTAFLVSLIIGITTGLMTNYFYLRPPSPAVADVNATTEYWRGTVDQRMMASEDRDKQVFAKLDSIESRIASICNDITAVKIDAARNGALYGVLSALGSYIVGLLIQTLVARKNNSRRKP